MREEIKKKVSFVVIILSAFIIYNFLSAKVAALIGSLILIFIFARAHGDFVLLLSEKFGKNPDTLKGKVVWITGASSGLGEGMALSLAKVNSKLVLSSRNKSKLEDVKKKCLECSNLDPKDILILPLDMVDYKEHEPAFKVVLDHFNQLDILVSNAGRSQRARWEKIDVEVDKELFDLNVFSMVSLARIVTRYFLSVGRGHHVVNLSVASLVGLHGSASYTGAKHAARGYFESLRMELGNKGIDVTLICPGPVESNLMDSLFRETSEEIGSSPRVGNLMPTDRFSNLACVAIANGLSEAWISHQPALLLLYLYQYFPTLIKYVVTSVDFCSLAAKIRDGRQHYKD